jgi:hypothetical protein
MSIATDFLEANQAVMISVLQKTPELGHGIIDVLAAIDTFVADQDLSIAAGSVVIPVVPPSSDLAGPPAQIEEIVLPPASVESVEPTAPEVSPEPMPATGTEAHKPIVAPLPQPPAQTTVATSSSAGEENEISDEELQAINDLGSIELDDLEDIEDLDLNLDDF